jgi:DNA-binding MarR family transcriptional regulator
MQKSFREEIKSDIKDERRKLILNILYTSNWIDKIYSPIFKKNRITNAQFNILRILKGSSPTPLSVGEIKERIMFKQTDITRMIDRLVEKELVIRCLCKNNRRKMDVSISEVGESLLNKINPEIEVAEKKHFSKNITSEEAKEANSTVDKLRGWKTDKK